MAESTRTTRPAALRLTDADRDRLLRYGATVRAAVVRLLDIADEHERCPEPPPPPVVPAPVRRHVGPPIPATRYKVDRTGGEEPLVTTDLKLAQDTASAHGSRVRRA